jgi:hypothetical protein
MPSQHDYKVALQVFQSHRLRRDHADLAEEDQYRALGAFVFGELYGPHDFSARDEQARRLHQFIHAIPGVRLRDIAQVFELLEISNRLDETVAAWLVALDAPLDFDEALYERAYRMADNYDQRLHQLELVRAVLYNVRRLARKPLLGAALRHSQSLAHSTGMSDIHRFLWLGYQAIQPVRDIHHFVETVDLRERDRLDRMYADRLIGWEHATNRPTADDR